MNHTLFARSILVMAIFIFSTFLNAQTVIPENGTVEHDGKIYPCLVIHLDPETKTLKKAWQDYLKDEYDVKLKGIGFLTNKDVLSAKEVLFTPLSEKTIDFYTEIIEDESGSQMSVFASHGYDSYVSQKDYPAEYANMRMIFERFLKSYVPNYYQELVNDTQKVVDDLTKDQRKLKKSIDKDSRKIEKLSREIDELKQDLEENSGELKETEEKLTGRKQKLELLKLKLNNVKQ